MVLVADELLGKSYGMQVAAAATDAASSALARLGVLANIDEMHCVVPC